jgi:hypothetical protein
MRRLRGYGLVRLEPPYERVTIFRPDEPGQPKRMDRATHPTSIINLMNVPLTPGRSKIDT